MNRPSSGSRVVWVSALLAAFVTSGASGLVYEVVWTRALATLVGGTALAAQVVLATFFAGTTAGAFWLGRRAARAPDGLRFYGRLELALAIAGLWSLVALGWARGPVAALTDGGASVRTGLVALGATVVACLPATALMGATYAAVARGFAQLRPDGGSARILGLAYAANTGGAVVGAVGAAFVALPRLGVRGTLMAAVAANLAAALLVALAARGNARTASPTAPDAGPARVSGPVAFALLASGFAAISLEIVALRVLAVTLLDTVYTFALAIGAYIAGAAATAALFGRLRRTWSLDALAAAAAVLSVAWAWALRAAGPLHDALAVPGGGFFASLMAEGVLAAAVAAPAAVPTTWLFLALAARAGAEAPATGARAATAWNAIGCALAPLVSALVLLPRGGTVAVAAAALVALVATTVLLAGRTRRVSIAIAAVSLLAVVPLRDGLYGWFASEGFHIVWKREGAGASVAVEESPTGTRRLRTNNTYAEGGDAALLSQLREGLLGTMFVPEARRALVLGVGSGITLAGAVAGLPEARFDAVELLAEVRAALPFFARSHEGIERHPAVTIHVADARSYVAHARAAESRYDLVLGELFHAMQAGTGALYAREHFEAVRDLVSESGVYVQWVPMHEAPPDEVRTIVRTFFGVFPHGGAWLGGWALRSPLLGLVGATRPLRLDAARAQAHLLASDPHRARRARQGELDRWSETLATWLADADALRTWAGPGPVNSDDRPELELRAPRGTGRELGLESLGALLPLWERAPLAVVIADEGMRRDVAAMRAAAAAFVRGARAWAEGRFDESETQLAAAVASAPGFEPPARMLADLRALRARAATR